MFTSRVRTLFRKAARSFRADRSVSLTANMNSRRMSTAWIWVAGIFAAALVGAACDGFTVEKSESTAAPVPTPVIELVPTATLIPTATAIPLPSPTPGRTVSTPTAGETACVLDPPEPDHPTISASDEAWRFLFELTREFSPRESATDEEYAAGEALNCVLMEMGYATEFQEFQRLASVVSSVVVPDAPPELRVIQSRPIEGSFVGEAAGEMVFVGLALPEDIGDQRLDGKIALIERGAITFQEKVERVEAAGAVGAVIFNREEVLFRGVMIDEEVPAIPAIGISRGHGLALREAIEEGGLELTVGIRNVQQPSRNLIAEIPGQPDGQDVVIVGAHYDTVHLTQGANDNGSGLTALMAIAHHVIDSDYPFTVRLLLFGSEEVGLLGSRHYVEQLTEQEREEIIAMINFDALGSGVNLLRFGHPDLTGPAATIAEGNGISMTTVEVDGVIYSDHVPFRDADIPVIMLSADDVSRINSARDTLDFVDQQLIVWAVDIGIGLLDHLAQTVEN